MSGNMTDQTPNPAQQPLGPQERTVSIAIKTPGLELPTTLENIKLMTTVGDLKRAIKEQSPTHPAETRQRLIFHGKPLLRDDATLIDALGEQMIRDMDTVTIHMVIRDHPDGHSSNPSPAPRPIAAPTFGSASSSTPPHPGDAPQANQPQVQMHQNIHGPRIPRQQAPGVANPFTPMNVTSAMSQQQRQFMAQWANTLHREGLNRQVLAAHSQMHRAAMNANGQTGPAAQPSVLPAGYGPLPTGSTPPAGYHPMGAAAENARGRSSPAPSLQPGMTRTIVREGVSPDGTRWRIVNQHPAPVDPSQRPAGNGGLSAHDVQNILRNADASHASQAVASAMQRSASNVSHQSSLQPHVGTTTPLMPGSRPLSRTATPDPTRTPSYGNSVLMPGANTMGQTPVAPQVYLVQSPEGPRALLFNQAGAWFTPLMHAQPASPHPLFPPPFLQTTLAPATQFGPAPTVANPQGPQRRNVQQGNVNVGRRGVVAQRRRFVRPIHPPNPGGAAWLARAWTHIWLLLRLGLFVWWFTGPETSWPRWLTIVAIAATIFVLNTGILNGVAEQIWGPLRRHFENMIPLQAPRGQPPHRPGAALPAARGNQDNGRGGEPNPADMAARLVEQRREVNANWLMDQIRRVERAGLLFLASLAPGIAERHIRQLEEGQQRQERERREAEAAAQARLQEQADGAANGNGDANGGESQSAGNQDGTDGEGSQGQQGAQARGGNADNVAPPNLLPQAA